MPLIRQYSPTCSPAGQEAWVGSQFIINANSLPLGQIGPSMHTPRAGCFC